MRPPRRLFLHLAAAALLPIVCQTARAQIYPTRPITIVVPFAAGGPTDTIGRIIARRMSASLSQTIIIENLTGAAGSIAVGRVVHAEPDGYTVSIGHIGTHVLNGAIYTLQYDLLNDLEPIAMVATNPQLIVGRKDLPPYSLNGLIEWLRANPDRALQGTAGIGSPSHVAGIYFQNKTHTQFQLIPYRGAGPVMQDMLAGRIDFTFDQAANSLPQVQADRIKVFAVTSKSHLAVAPEIPTVDEAGLPEFYMSVWHGLWVPKGTPQNIVAKLNAAVVDTLADAAVRDQLSDLGQEIPSPKQQTPEALAAFQKAEIEKWWPIVKAAGIKGE
jgi:tripartite-type tricarboxylate transporter receptor subunit TctC